MLETTTRNVGARLRHSVATAIHPADEGPREPNSGHACSTRGWLGLFLVAVFFCLGEALARGLVAALGCFRPGTLRGACVAA